jgi:hypothetical protein
MTDIINGSTKRLSQFGASGYFSRNSLQYWNVSSLTLQLTSDIVAILYRQPHCSTSRAAGQWLILDSYCASFKLLSRDTNACIDVQLSYREWHVTRCAQSHCGTRVAGCALCYHVVTSHWIFNRAACYRKNLWRSCDKVISVGTPAIRHIHVQKTGIMDNEKDIQNVSRLIPGRERFLSPLCSRCNLVHPFFHPVGTMNCILGEGKVRLNCVNKTHSNTPTVCTWLHTVHMDSCT